jgi:hypothetical protein
MPSVRALLFACAFAVGCRFSSPGLPSVTDAALTSDGRRDGISGDARPDAPPALDSPREVAEPDGLAAPAAAAGCADATREGFPDIKDWPDIAGCSGAWRVPGLLGPEARLPQCGREAGNNGRRATGEGCSVADLCADGWHVCRDATEVERRSPSGCESASTEPESRLFVVLAGASAMGVCFPDPTAANDIYGCGTLGDPVKSACSPLDRHMGFAECLSWTDGIWSCGAADDHLREAAVVVKTASGRGGALCCRD